jgi:polyisoprenyl-phosphate glycosyltransferase
VPSLQHLIILSAFGLFVVRSERFQLSAGVVRYSQAVAKPEDSSRIVILIPVFNDWEAANLLLTGLDEAFARQPSGQAEVLFVDDGSTLAVPPGFGARKFTALRRVDILRLRRNLGHQRAIAVGLVFVYQNLACRAVVVMDGDGEDRPEDIATLAGKFKQENDRAIIFAERSKRFERPLFRIFYRLYRLIHVILTGDPVRVGNFSMVPFEALTKLVVLPEIWQHYAAAVIRSRLGHRSIPIARGRRVAGQSKMTFISLLLHGLTAFFVYGDIVGARLLVGIALALVAEIVLVAIGIGANLAATGLSAYAAAILGIVLLQAIPIALIVVFVVIGSRVNSGFLPIRDCPYFVSRVESVFPVN